DLSLATNTVQPSSSLFEGARVPAQVMVDDVTAEAVQVHSLTKDSTADQDLWEEGTVEGQHETLAHVAWRFSVDHTDRRRCPVGPITRRLNTSLFIIVLLSMSWRNVDCYCRKIFTERIDVLLAILHRDASLS